MTREPLRVAVVGCGDAFHRHYLPALRAAGAVSVAGCCDRRPEAARRAADVASALPYGDLDRLLEAERPQAVLNLTPPPAHAAVTRACLEAGVAVYSEKPLASTLDEADELIELAESRGRLLLCAPGSAATRRVRWLAELAASRRYGPLTLVVGQQANLGPAAWREYEGDPAVFYSRAVGPLVDHGIYRLHEMTALLGPVLRVQAMATTAIPRRRVRARASAPADSVAVSSPDHVLVNLEFRGGALGQLLASFAVPASLAPWLELHFRDATLSFCGDQWDPRSPASLFVDDGSDGGGSGWLDGPPSGPPDELSVIGTGALHFLACLRGETRPVLTARHARHVLEVILAAYASIEDGRAREVSSGF